MDADRCSSDVALLHQQIVAAAQRVAHVLGSGHPEHVYAQGLETELRSAGIDVAAHHPLCVSYDGTAVGEYFGDLLVKDLVLVEIKAIEAGEDRHPVQCGNYLRASGHDVCMLFNFGGAEVEQAVVRRL